MFKIDKIAVWTQFRICLADKADLKEVVVMGRGLKKRTRKMSKILCSMIAKRPFPKVLKPVWCPNRTILESLTGVVFSEPVFDQMAPFVTLKSIASIYNLFEHKAINTQSRNFQKTQRTARGWSLCDGDRFGKNNIVKKSLTLLTHHLLSWRSLRSLSEPPLEGYKRWLPRAVPSRRPAPFRPPVPPLYRPTTWKPAEEIRRCCVFVKRL